MQCKKVNHRENRGERCAVLTARIVRDDATPLRRDDVHAIEYSLYELDPCWPHQLTVVAGNKCVPLDVGRVLLNELCLDEYWSMDTMGYNFRHALRLECPRPLVKPSAPYEVRYDIILATGEVTVLRFLMRSRRSACSWSALSNPRIHEVAT